MSLPDYLLLCRGEDVPPRIAAFPYRLALLPIGISMDDLGNENYGQTGIFLVEPDCAHRALNDAAFSGYLSERIPVLFYARRARDLRPFLRRVESLERRGYSAAVLAP